MPSLSIPFRRAGRNLSTCSIDSGYGSGLYGDARTGSGHHPRDLVCGSTTRESQPRATSPDVKEPIELEVGNEVAIKKEEYDSAPSTPRLTICTVFSSPSSPDPVSPASPSEVRRSHARKSTGKLPSQAVRQLTAWLNEHRHHPYPSTETKHALAEACSISVKQVTTWFTNIRQRQLKSQDDDAENSNNAHNQNQYQTSRKGKKKDYSRSNGASPIEGLLSPPRLSPSASISEYSSGEGDNWQCTFCGKSLTAKSWRRHEETQHYPKHQWTCLAHGPRIHLPSSSTSICAFCELENPDDDHLRFFHRIGECSCKSAHERTFGRPDHLQQHARNFHRCEHPLSELVRDTWRSDGPGLVDNMSWTCGFCQETLPTWDARATHIAGHFKAGLTMAQWCGDQVSQPILPREYTEPSDPAALDALASMGVTLAGPSNPASNGIGYAHSQLISQIQAQPVPTTAMTTVATSIPEIDFNSFPFHGNAIDTFDPQLPNNTPYYPTVSTMPAVSQSFGVFPMDFGVIGIDEHGNPIYDMSIMHSF